MSLLSSAALRLQGRPYHWAAAAVLLVVGGWFYLPYLTRMPSGMHAWAQSDRLALAINFYDYGFQFLKPRVSSLNSIGGITGVEFPAQAYAAALGGLVFGRDSINLLFRLLDVGLTLLGGFFLFRLVFERTGHFVAALIPACFLLSSPVFAFYAGNYLPDPASLSLSFVGYYYWLRFFESRAFRDLLLGVLLLTLASLMKTTTALFFAAALGITFVWSYFLPEMLTKRQKGWFVGLALVAVGLIGWFFRHNQQLNAEYQSGMFLAEAKPIKDDAMLHTVLRFIREHLWQEYATLTQYRILAACAVLLVVFLLPNLRRHRPLLLLTGAAALVAYAFFWLMGEQFMGHEYYVISSFGPPALLLLLLALLNLGHYRGWVRWATSAGLLVLAFVLLRDGHKTLTARMADDGSPWLQDGPALLSAHGVALQAPVLVLGDEAPNTMLVYADRRGKTWGGSPGALSADYVAGLMAQDSIEYVLMSRPFYEGMAAQHDALRGAFAPVMDQPFVVLRRLDMHRPW
jgi:hypothetical protein